MRSDIAGLRCRMEGMVTHCFLSPELIFGRPTLRLAHIHDTARLPALAQAQPRTIIPMATLLIEQPYPSTNRP